MENNFRIDLTKSISTWSRSLKIRRGIWHLLIFPIFYLLPRPANKLRIGLLRLMGAKIGHTCLVEPRVRVLMPWNLEMGNFVVLGRGVDVYNYALVKIDDMTVISQRCNLCTGTHDYAHPHMPLIWKPITVGSECWVAAESFLAPGVVIGNGAVIGARSVVTKNMPEWMVCAGNPCKPIKSRVLKSI